MLCEKCFSEVDDDFKFCPYCGFSLPKSSNLIPNKSSEVNKQIESIYDYVDLSEKMFKNFCTRLEFRRLEKNSSKYFGTPTSVKGYVIYVLEDDYGEGLILLETPKRNGDTISIIYSGSNEVLKKDTIKVYGYITNDLTYENNWGTSTTVPCVSAKYIDIIEDEKSD